MAKLKGVRIRVYVYSKVHGWVSRETMKQREMFHAIGGNGNFWHALPSFGTSAAVHSA